MSLSSHHQQPTPFSFTHSIINNVTDSVQVYANNNELHWDTAFIGQGELSPTFVHTTETFQRDGSILVRSEVTTEGHRKPLAASYVPSPFPSEYTSRNTVYPGPTNCHHHDARGRYVPSPPATSPPPITYPPLNQTRDSEHQHPPLYPPPIVAIPEATEEECAVWEWVYSPRRPNVSSGRYGNPATRKDQRSIRPSPYTVPPKFNVRFRGSGQPL